MLYDGAIRFMQQAIDAAGQQDLYRQNECSQRAQKIITELTSCLDMQRGGEIAQNLLALYTFAYNELVEGNLLDDPNRIQNSLTVMTQLRDSWIELEQQQRSTTSETRLAS